MSVVLVTGGTGNLGRPLVTELKERGHDVRVLSRRPGAGTHTGDLTTGAGLEPAVEGAGVVIHCASDSHRLGRSDPAQTLRLVDAIPPEAHLIYISSVGIDSIPYGYYKRKLMCEQLITARNRPYTILRATQFHELLAYLLRRVERLPVAPLPLHFKFQLIAASEVATRLVDLAEGPPAGRAPDIGGPEVLTLDSIARAWQTRRGRPERLVNLPIPGQVGAGFRRGLNTCPHHRDGKQTWKEFVDSDI